MNFISIWNQPINFTLHYITLQKLGSDGAARAGKECYLKNADFMKGIQHASGNNFEFSGIKYCPGI